MFLEWGLGGTSLQLAPGLRRKNKPCRKKKKTMKKKEKCAVIFKKPVSYCRFVSALERPVFTGAVTRVAVSLGLRLFKREGLGHPSILPSFIRWPVHTARHCAGLRGAVWNPVLAPPELTDQWEEVGS